MEQPIPGKSYLPESAPQALLLIESLALRRAAGDIVGSWPDGPGLPGPRVVASELLRLSECLAGRSSEGAPPVPAFDPDLLDIVRAQLLEQVSEGPQDGEFPEQDLEALETLRSGFSVPAQPLHSVDDSTSQENPQTDEGLSAVEMLQKPTGLQLAVEMAHDIRSPLSSILFLSDALRLGHSGEINDLQKRQLGLIYSAALGLAGVVNDVVELAKSGSTLRNEQSQILSVSAVIASVQEMVAPMAEEKGVVLVMSGPERDLANGYPVSLGRVLLNLVTNALHHTEAGQVTVTVRPVSRTVLEFSVEDTGTGIGDDAREMLFQPFRCAPDGSRTLFSGTGLGLSIARGLVEAMKGELGFETEIGRGTRFWFRLPMPPSRS